MFANLFAGALGARQRLTAMTTRSKVSAAGAAGTELARKSSRGAALAAAVRRVSQTGGLAALRDALCDSEAFIHPSRLKTTKMLGEGAFGSCACAELQPKDGSPAGAGTRKGSPRPRLVAVKALRQELLEDEDHIHQFVKEVEILRKLRHTCASSCAQVSVAPNREASPLHPHASCRPLAPQRHRGVHRLLLAAQRPG